SSATNWATAKAKGLERAIKPSLRRTILATMPRRCLFSCRRMATLLFGSTRSQRMAAARLNHVRCGSFSTDSAEAAPSHLVALGRTQEDQLQPHGPYCPLILICFWTEQKTLMKSLDVGGSHGICFISPCAASRH